MRMTENLGGLCMNCARTAWTPGVGAADAGSQAHAGLRDRLCLESRATFARNEQTRQEVERGVLSLAGASWCWSVALDTRREELVTPRGPALQEIVQGHCHLQCVSAGKAFDTRREERECVRGFRHTAGKMRRGIKS